MVLVCLDVCAKWNSTVFLEVHGASSDDLAWAKCIVHAVLGSEVVQPEDGTEDSVGNHNVGHFSEWCTVNGRAGSVLYSADISLDFRNMIALCADIRCGVELVSDAFL